VLTVTLLPQTGTIAGGWPRLSRCASVDGPRPSPGRVLVMASARDHARGGASHIEDSDPGRARVFASLRLGAQIRCCPTR